MPARQPCYRTVPYAFGILLLFAATGISRADVLCPRVTTAHNADVSDLTRFRQDHRWRDKTGEDLAIAVWQYLCDRETGLYHMNTVNDGPDPWSEYSTVRDPIKLLNVYNVGYCGIFGPALDGVFQGIGFSRGRAFGVPGWNHCTTEVGYGGGWHYFDLDVRGALRKPDGSIASVAEAQQNRELWVDPACPIEPFFPKDRDRARVFEIYRDSRIDYFYRWFQAGHVMDFRLRQGESLTRWWRPQGGRWHHQEAYNRGFVRKLLEQPPRGYKSNHPEFSIWTQGNGRWEYQPDLTRASSDFTDGVHTVENLKPGTEGLRRIAAGHGQATFEVFSPWIITARINDLDDPHDDAEASSITLDAGCPLALHVSRDQGRSWQPVATVAPGSATVDLTRWVQGSYGFLVRLQSAGQAGELVLRSLRLETWVQVAPISLPRLAQGRNRCTYALGDRYGRLTRPMFVLPNVADPEDLSEYVVQLPEDYDLQRKTARIRGDVILKLEPPAGYLIDWFTPGACFTTHQNQAAADTDNRIAFAVGKPTDFVEIYRADVPTWVNHWRYQWDQDVRLDQPAEAAFVRYTGDPGLNVIRATVHLRPLREPDRALRITHAYRVQGELVEKRIQLPDAGDYTIDVPGKPENVFIRMEVPSRRTHGQ